MGIGLYLRSENFAEFKIQVHCIHNLKPYMRKHTRLFFLKAWNPVLCSTLFNSLQTSLTQGSDFFGLIYRYENKMNLLGVLRFRIHFVSIRFFGDNFLAQITRMSMLYA